MKLFNLGLLAIVFQAALTSCTQQSDIPRPDHVIVVVEENHGYDQVIKSPNAPFINQLASGGALFIDSHGVTHPSQPNYLALFSGSVQGVTDDACLDTMAHSYTTPNLGAALLSKGFTFSGYAQTMPAAGFTGCSYLKSDSTDATLYARKHAPWVNWQGDGENGIPANLSIPMSQFPKDFSKLPTLAFVVPDMDYDMHNIGAPGDAAAIRRGDKWLKDNLWAYAEWAKTHNSLLIVTFDEDDFKDVNHIPTIFYGQSVKPGEYAEKINHYNVLHTLEAMFGLTTADATGATVIDDVWKKG